MIYVGIDDTDVVGSRGTNQLARSLVAALSSEYRCWRIVRHQLLQDPRVPCTTKNGSASILLEPLGGLELEVLTTRLRHLMRDSFVPGSDPGLCVASRVPSDVVAFGYRCKSEFVTRREALDIARCHHVFLAGLGGTNDGVIGALAAIGLSGTGDDGRVVQIADWPDDLSGNQSIEALQRRGVLVKVLGTDQQIHDGLVDIGKRLRPNRRGGSDVLFVEEPTSSPRQVFKAIKLP